MWWAMRLEVYYDGWCPLCTRVRERLDRLDWLGLLTFRSIREPGVAAALGVPAERLEQRMYVRAWPSGRLADGIWAVAAVAARVPALMPLWPFIQLLAWLGVGQRLYDWIASRRAIVPVGNCDGEACSVHRPR